MVSRSPILIMKALTVFDPQSPQARAVFHLAIVAGIIFAAIFRDRLRDDWVCADALSLARRRRRSETVAGIERRDWLDDKGMTFPERNGHLRRRARW